LLELFEDQEENVTGFVGWIFNTLKPKYSPVSQGKNIMDEFSFNNDFDEQRPVRKVSNLAAGAASSK
jgi:hypothetical protein